MRRDRGEDSLPDHEYTHEELIEYVEKLEERIQQIEKWLGREMEKPNA